MSVFHAAGLAVILNFTMGVVAMAATTKTAASLAVPAPTILSFKDWKTEKAAEARTRYDKLESDYIAKKAQNPKDSKLKAIYKELKDTKAFADEAKELTVSDYFVGYLSRFKDQKSTYKIAAEKLNSVEVAELMTAYAESLLKTSGEGISTNSEAANGEASK